VGLVSWGFLGEILLSVGLGPRGGGGMSKKGWDWGPKGGWKTKRRLPYRLISCEAMWNSMSFVDTEKAISLIEKVAGFGRHLTFCE